MTTFDLEAWLESQEWPAEPALIVQAGAAVLRKRAADVPASLFGTHALAQLVEIMVETMRAAPGVGLAAPQIGVPLRLFVAEDTPEHMTHMSPEARDLRGRAPLALTVLANPQLTLAGGDEATFFEGCLSVRGYAALVRRASAVTLTGVDAGGVPRVLRLEGWPARIMQHETDHLDGMLYVDRMITRSFASESELATLAAASVSEVLRELGEP